MKLNISLFIIWLCFVTGSVSAQSKNFVQDEVVKVSGIVTADQLYSLNPGQKQTTRVYYDGLGRVIQSVAVQASPLQKDIVQPVVYNNIGQQTKSLLPYVSSEGNKYYRPDAVTSEQPNFYNNGNSDKVADDNSPFSQQVFENSPLQRLLKSGVVGTGFQPAGASGTQHYKTMNYRSNQNVTDGNIIIWGPDGSNIGNYADNLLSVVDGTDEEGIETLAFSNLTGQTVLKRQKNGALNMDTYYIYNNAGNVSYVIPPLALKAMIANSNYDPNQSVISKLIFRYVYDSQGRLVEKTVPGAGVIYIVYDPLNRPVLVQDARLRISNQWNYIKYDVKDHPISQGIYTDASNTTRTAMQAYVATTIAASYNTSWYESRYTAPGTGYYTNSVFPTNNITALAYSYYDDYDLDGNGTADYTYKPQSLTNESTPTTGAIKGIPTMVRSRTVGTGAGINNIWLIKVLFYDKNNRTIQTQSNNQLNYTAEKITDYSTSAPDFTGVPQQTKVVKVTGTAATPITASILTTFTYDHMYRVMAADQNYNSGATVHIAAYSYNELGQLIDKKLQPGTSPTTQDITLNGSNSVTSGSSLNVIAGRSIALSPGFSAANGSTFSASINPGALQSVDFRYNIRGQLLSINNSKLTDDSGTANTNNDDNDLFGMQLLYDQSDSNLGNTAYFNGRLSGVKWMSRDVNGAQGNERGYKYTYDALNRYTGSTYAERAATGTGAFNININGFNETGISYDDGGNLLSMKRSSVPTGGGSPVEFDNLTYVYDSSNPNQLKTVTDGAGTNYTGYGFRNLSGNTTNSYTYDVNGNLITDPYKALVLDYNVLNRTDKITITSATGRYIAYTYNAGGQLIRKQQFDNNTLQNTTDYIDGMVYINNVLSYFSMPEGRVRNTGGGSTVTLKPEYIISDQQGNARISLEESSTMPGIAVVRQENSYYGFGLVMPGSTVATPTTDNKQLYNGGSEWQKDFSNLPDYYQTYYRNYDVALGRFIGVDPMAESSESMTSYNYAGNNPIIYNDPMGDIFRDWSQVNSTIGTLMAYQYGGWATGEDDVHEFKSGDDAFYTSTDRILTGGVSGGYGLAGDFQTAWNNFTSKTPAVANQSNVNEYHLNQVDVVSQNQASWNAAIENMQKQMSGLLIDANQRGPNVSIESSIWEINRIAANFSVSGINASSIQIIQTYSGSGGLKGKMSFVDGGIKSPYAKQMGGPAQSGKPYYLTPDEFANGVTWNGTSGSVLFTDKQGGAYYNDISRFNVIVVAVNVNGSGIDRLLGGFTWGYNNMAPINGGQIIYSPTVSPAAIQIIKHDYPEYKFR